MIEIRRISAAEAGNHLDRFSNILQHCVQKGASVGFVLPFTEREAADFWEKRVFPDARTGSRVLFGAFVDGTLAGTVHLDLGTMPNQPHRAEVSKLLVDPAYRRRGLAAGLMQAIEKEALLLDRTLLTLDTRTGDAAEKLYLSLGFQRVGEIPNFAVDPHTPQKLDATTIMYKNL